MKKNDNPGNCDYCKFGYGHLSDYGEWRLCAACEKKLRELDLEEYLLREEMRHD